LTGTLYINKHSC